MQRTVPVALLSARHAGGHRDRQRAGRRTHPGTLTSQGLTVDGVGRVAGEGSQQ
ncbi:hypothetical protein [Streptomyces brevispora]|uniref:hypothetical protein n=1 Tax=Streptomyces brevispora TaxID=887462 RepID=UPI00142E9BD2|nr:hypothetical protein [Streptomyces brevispora]